MTRRDSNSGDETPTEATDPPPGPADRGREGGMSTREVSPDVVKKSKE